jgi:hypothetical protein
LGGGVFEGVFEALLGLLYAFLEGFYWLNALVDLCQLEVAFVGAEGLVFDGLL